MNPELSAGPEAARTELAASGAFVVELVEYPNPETETRLGGAEDEAPVRPQPVPAPQQLADIITFPGQVDLGTIDDRHATLRPQPHSGAKTGGQVVTLSAWTTAGRANRRELNLGRKAA